MKALIVDNFDSFIYNLKYELEALDIEVTVCRNNIEYAKLRELVIAHELLVISPGSGNPASAGHSIDLIQEFAKTKPILGICLGHQSIVEAFGGLVSKAKSLVHGKTSNLSIENHQGLFAGLDSTTSMARYHSLSASKIPSELSVDAYSSDGEIMAVSHCQYPCFGLQFHPESIMSMQGHKILNNFKLSAQKFIKEQPYAAIA